MDTKQIEALREKLGQLEARRGRFLAILFFSLLAYFAICVTLDKMFLLQQWWEPIIAFFVIGFFVILKLMLIYMNYALKKEFPGLYKGL